MLGLVEDSGRKFLVWSTLLILGDHFSLFLADPLAIFIESGCMFL